MIGIIVLGTMFLPGQCIANSLLNGEKDISIYQTQLEKNKEKLSKAKTLLEEGIITKKEYEDLQNKYNTLNTNYKIATSQTDMTGLKLENINAVKEEIIKSQKDLESLKSEYNKMSKLFDEGLISEEELINIELEYQAITVKIENLKQMKDNPVVVAQLTPVEILKSLYSPFKTILKSSNYFITSKFGLRVHPLTGLKAFHNGLDIAMPLGTPVYAYSDGAIELATCAKYSGNFVKINHGNGFTTFYLHLLKYVVKSGQKVKKGQLIGYIGSTGRSTGSHLHFEIRKNGKPLNINHFVKS